MQCRGISLLSMCVVDESRQALGPEGRHARSSGSLRDSRRFINFEEEGIVCLCVYLCVVFLSHFE